jgi:hypothetical protein
MHYAVQALIILAINEHQLHVAGHKHEGAKV